MSPKIFSYKNLPKNRVIRITLGILFIIGGILGALPILGFWMFPIGLLFLSVDFAIARRWRRRIEVWWGRRQRKKGNKRP
ncbi:MAG: hypothetical protein IH901_07450 [Proteobacteria bacterium]|nr:hypothetical protein [Pseudomonadota bacterium]